jgi:dephospho-CoA kinase
MFIIGLTGGIGTGKSTVSSYLENKGCLILDADKISRQMTEKGQPALEDIGRIFGFHLINEDGNLDRQALGNIVFSNKEKLDILQSIITQKVVEHINNRLIELKNNDTKGIVVIDAPLLFECGMEGLADENWLVIASLDVRLERVKRRDGLSENEILSRINNQMPQEDKEKLSQVILDNSTTLDELYRQIDVNLDRVKKEF